MFMLLVMDQLSGFFCVIEQRLYTFRLAAE